MKTKTFWLSYDLGLSGDYNSMYIWLDNHKAKECGDSLAVFKFDYDNDFIAEILHSLGGKITLKPSLK